MQGAIHVPGYCSTAAPNWGTAPVYAVEVHLPHGNAEPDAGWLTGNRLKAKQRPRHAAPCRTPNLDFPSLKRITHQPAPADLPKEGGRFSSSGNKRLGLLARQRQIPAKSLNIVEMPG